MRRALAISLWLTLGVGAVSGQQLPQFAQYQNDMLQINPAYAGSGGYVESVVHQRNQWTGFGDGPRTSILSTNMLFKETYGAGLSLYRDAYGPIRKNAAIGAYSHKLPLNGELSLHLGLSAGMFQFVMDGTKVETTSTGDPLVDYNTTTKRMAPDFSAGVMLHHRKFYAGLSAQHLNKSNIQAFEEFGRTGVIGLEHHYYLMGGYQYRAAEEAWAIRPSFMVQYLVNSPMQVHLQVIGEYADKFELGLGVRNGDALTLFTGYRLNFDWSLHYSYDFQFSKMMGSNFGSHEIVLAHEFWANRSGSSLAKKRYKITKSGKRVK